MSDQVDAIYRAIQFLEENLGSEITVSQIADEVGYSLFHFMRTFNRLVHHTPIDYLTRRRLSEAAKKIISTEGRLIDIALEYGFGSQESFSRAFKRMFNLQPSLWRDNGMEVLHLLMPPLGMEDLIFINKRIQSPPTIENREKRTLFGLMSSVGEVDENTDRCYKKLEEDLTSLCFQGRQQKIIAVSAAIHPDKKSKYLFVGMEDSNFFCPPMPVVQFTVPAGLYATFHTRNEDCLAARNYLFHTWLAGKGFFPAGNIEITERVFGDSNTNLTIIDVPIQPLLNTGKKSDFDKREKWHIT